MESDNKTDKDEVTLLQILNILLKHKKFIIISTLSIVGISLIYLIISIILPPEMSPLPDIYTSSALVLVSDESRGGISSIMAAPGLSDLASLAGLGGASMSYGKLAITLLKSRSIVDIIAEKFDIAKRYHIEEDSIGNKRKAILRHLITDFDTETSTLKIEYTDYDPEFAKNVVNQFVEILDKRFVNIGINRKRIQRDQLEHKLIEVKKEITRLELLIKDFQTRYKIFTESFYSDYVGVLPPQNQLPQLAMEFQRLQRDLMVQEKIYEMLTPQYELLKLTVEGEGQIIQVLELGEAPDVKSGPSRALILIIVVFITILSNFLIVFTYNWIKAIKKDNKKY